MDLKDFITSTLTQIVRAVEETNTALVDSQAVVSPKGGYLPDGRHQAFIQGNYAPFTEVVEFDVAVTAREGSENKGGAAVSIVSISLGTMRSKEQEDISVSRIKFKIPLLLPQYAGDEVKQKSKGVPSPGGWGGAV